MPVKFQIDAFADVSDNTVEFGVGRDDRGDDLFVLAPTQLPVKRDLADIARRTIAIVSEMDAGSVEFDPAETYGSLEYVWLPIESPLGARVVRIHEGDFQPSGSALDHPSEIFCYFARFEARDGTRLTGIKRSSQFKSLLRSPLIKWAEDGVYRVEDDTFKLDSDFDVLVDSVRVHILRPAGFEFLGQLQAVVLANVDTNVADLRAAMEFVDFGPIAAYARVHPRAARYLAAIRSQGHANDVDRSRLVRLCRSTGVDVTVSNGVVAVQPGSELAFLEALDRRRYELELVRGSREQYRAPSRRRLH